MPRSRTSKRWLHAHFNDTFVKKAQQEGYRSRAVYKLQEIDAKGNLLKPGSNVIELGAAPGAWTQYIIERLQGRGAIIAVDILPMQELPGIIFILGDFREEAVWQELMQHIPQEGVDLILSDMSPNMSGAAAIDIPKAMYLAELALEFSNKVLKVGGTLLMKIFHGEGFDALLKLVRLNFTKVVARKPQASRAHSRETYLLATGFKKLN